MHTLQPNILDLHIVVVVVVGSWKLLWEVVGSGTFWKLLEVEAVAVVVRICLQTKIKRALLVCCDAVVSNYPG